MTTKEFADGIAFYSSNGNEIAFYSYIRDVIDFYSCVYGEYELVPISLDVNDFLFISNTVSEAKKKRFEMDLK